MKTLIKLALLLVVIFVAYTYYEHVSKPTNKSFSTELGEHAKQLKENVGKNVNEIKDGYNKTQTAEK
jgi:hypothetical protein